MFAMEQPYLLAQYFSSFMQKKKKKKKEKKKKQNPQHNFDYIFTHCRL